ncbi:unnamed protein product [Rangifer tarandus platyrhynchus]|uniref:Uncharacterized protein n=1 Tax=Rangifer tarandus platyrhynchus TaxID=3082113 RepID=A0ACB1KHK3_RANTA
MQSFISPVTKAILVALFIFAILLILYVILWAREPGAGPAPVGRSSPGLAGQREALAGDRSGGPAPAWGALGPSERLGTLAIGHPLRSGPGFPPTPSPWLAGKPVESAPCALLAFPGTPKRGLPVHLHVISMTRETCLSCMAVPECLQSGSRQKSRQKRRIQTGWRA